MNKLKFLILPFLFGFVLFSCSDSKSEEEGGNVVPPPAETYPIIVNMSLHAKYSVANEGSGETVIDVNHTIANAQSVTVVVHEQKSESIKAIYKLDNEELKKLVVDDQVPYKLSLEEGQYYVSIVAMMETTLDGANSATFLKPMTQNYKKAVAQVPNDYIYYKTAEIEVKPDAEQNKKVAMDLDRMTTDLVYEFVDANKVPAGGEYILEVGVNEVPAAFYLATGKALTDKEVKDQKLNKYTTVRNLPVPTTETKELVTQFHTLRNAHLEATAAERGEYWFEFSQMVEKEKKVLKSRKQTLGESNGEFYLTIDDLYGAKEVKVLTK